MLKYCKAYEVRELRRFPGWEQAIRPGLPELADDAVVYMLDDLTVILDDDHLIKGTHEEYEEDDFLLRMVTPEWKEFCTTELQFAVPDEYKFLYEEEAAGEAGDPEAGAPPAG